MKENVVIIFAKRPVLGKVKTRLAESIGEEKAYELYVKMLEHMLSAIPNDDYDSVIYWDSSVGESLFKLKTTIEQNEQEGANLGERMGNAFNKMLTLYKRVIIIGVDCPFVNKNTIKSAFNELSSHDVCIGPAIDGGYYLIGLKKTHNDIFINIKWGSGEVLVDTIKRLKSNNATYSMLPELRDIDTVEDLNYYS